MRPQTKGAAAVPDDCSPYDMCVGFPFVLSSHTPVTVWVQFFSCCLLNFVYPKLMELMWALAHLVGNTHHNLPFDAAGTSIFFILYIGQCASSNLMHSAKILWFYYFYNQIIAGRLWWHIAILALSKQRQIDLIYTHVHTYTHTRTHSHSHRCFFFTLCTESFGSDIFLPSSLPGSFSWARYAFWYLVYTPLFLWLLVSQKNTDDGFVLGTCWRLCIQCTPEHRHCWVSSSVDPNRGSKTTIQVSHTEWKWGWARKLPQLIKETWHWNGSDWPSYEVLWAKTLTRALRTWILSFVYK